VTLIREGEIYLQIGQSDSALFSMNQAMHLPGTPNDQSSLLLLYGDVYSQKGDFDQSIASYLQAKAMALKINRSSNVMNADLGLGKVYVKTGEYEKGLLHARQALETGRNLNNSLILQDMNTRLAEIFQLAGNYKKAYQFINAADSIREKAKGYTTSRLKT
jgi:tetratricopeptide (TPR) repeat protein